MAIFDPDSLSVGDLTDWVTVLLDHVIAEGPAEELEDVLRAVSGSLPPRQIDEWRERAIALRQMLEDRKRRARELSVLLDMTSELTSLHDLSEVLYAIIRRARSLLGTDTAYMTLNDVDVTYISVTDGIIHDRFKRIRLEYGSGLGGLVAQTKSAQWTSDYLADRRLQHSPEHDEIVRLEGLRAVLGVPVQIGDRVIGVLLAADRAPRAFEQEEVALLATLAGHAAVAIDNARLFKDRDATLSSLQRANDTIRRQAALLERRERFQTTLTELVLRGESLDGLAQELYLAAGGPILVVNPEGRILARSAAPNDASSAADAVQIPSRIAELASRIVADQAIDDGPVEVREGDEARWLFCPIVAGRQVLGYILWAADQPQEGWQYVKGASLAMGLVILKEQAVEDAGRRDRSERLRSLIQERRPEEVARRALPHLDLRAAFAVLAVERVETTSRELANQLDSFARQRPQTLVGEIEGRFLVVANAEDPTDFAEYLADYLRMGPGGSITIGAAGPGHSPEVLPTMVEYAQRTAQVLKALGLVGRIATHEEFAAYVLLFGDATKSQVDVFISAALGPVLAYDERKGSELFRTVEAFLDNAGHMQKTASALYIHVNTLYQRLERLTALLGEDWRVPDRQLQLHLACRMHRLRADL